MDEKHILGMAEQGSAALSDTLSPQMADDNERWSYSIWPSPISLLTEPFLMIFLYLRFPRLHINVFSI